MNPYEYIQQATINGESLLDLCCGIGLGLNGLNAKEVTAVDIHQLYLDEVKHRCGHAKTVCSDTLDYIKDQPDESVDVVSLIDAIEHMEKKKGLAVLKHAKRVARKKVLVFTPEGYLENDPHNAWGIEGGDEYQKHKSGWEIKELEKLGFKLVKKVGDISQHGEPYNALMFILDKEDNVFYSDANG